MFIFLFMLVCLEVYKCCVFIFLIRKVYCIKVGWLIVVGGVLELFVMCLL